MSVTTIDCDYLDRPGFAAAYLLVEGNRAAFVETNTNRAVPRLLEALRAAGRDPSEVEYVVITHVHLDHAGGAAALMEACPNATLLAHPRAAKHAIDPSKLIASARGVYGAEAFDAMYGEIRPVSAERVRVMEDGDSVALGGRTLTFLHTRGHADHHACVLDSGTNGIFTGDSFGLVYPALQKNGLFAIPSTSPTDFDAHEAKKSLDRILETGAERAYLTHFGEQRDLRGIAAALRAQLDEYGAIADEAFASGLEGEALARFCEERVGAIFERVLAERGLDGDREAREILATDRDLNAQGVAFSVERRRRRAQRG
ncbi:MAG TPA: MBL fold metallo-hydrolase [Sandaracinaceae bacterium]